MEVFIRGWARSATLPVIMLTAKGMDEGMATDGNDLSLLRVEGQIQSRSASWL